MASERLHLTTLAGLIIVQAGYSAAFIALGGVAAIGATVFLLAMPKPGVVAWRNRRADDHGVRSKKAKTADRTVSCPRPA
jgi:hypothetical protein